MADTLPPLTTDARAPEMAPPSPAGDAKAAQPLSAHPPIGYSYPRPEIYHPASDAHLQHGKPEPKLATPYSNSSTGPNPNPNVKPEGNNNMLYAIGVGLATLVIGAIAGFGAVATLLGGLLIGGATFAGLAYASSPPALSNTPQAPQKPKTHEEKAAEENYARAQELAAQQGTKLGKPVELKDGDLPPAPATFTPMSLADFSEKSR